MTNKIKSMLLLMATLVVTLMMSTMVFAAPGKISSVKQTYASESAAEIEWDADFSAYGYEIMYSTSSTDWTTNVGTKTTYSTKSYFSGLAAGKSYFVKVRAFDWDYNAGEWSDVFEMVTSPVKVTGITQTSATTTTATIKWNAVSGATSYEVYKSVGGTSTLLGETKGTTYTLKGINASTSYSIYVYALRSSASGSAVSFGNYLYSSYINLIPAKAAKPEGTLYYNSSKQIRFEWDEKDYADGYQIQVYKYNGKKAVISKTTNSTYYYATKMGAATFYKARVRAYTTINGKIQYGAWSDYNYVGQQIKPTLKYNRTTNKLKISWTKMKGATNYSIYMSTSQKTGYKKVVTTKKNTYTVSKFRKKKLTTKKTYYVYVVANKKVGKKTYKSGKQYCYYLY